MEQVNAKKFHKNVSILKSLLRILGYILLLRNFWVAVVVLSIAEGLGILEERFE